MLCSSSLLPAYLTVRLFTVLPCAILSPDHVHQQQPEREGFCHCLSYVGLPVRSNEFHIYLAIHAVMLRPCVALRYDGGGAGYSAGHRDPGADRGWRLRLSH